MNTSLENSHYLKLTGYEEMIEYLHRLENSSEKIKITTIGHSVQGRQIPALFFSNDNGFARFHRKRR